MDQIIIYKLIFYNDKILKSNLLKTSRVCFPVYSLDAQMKFWKKVPTK